MFHVEPTDAPAITGGPEGTNSALETAWTSRGTRRLNRLRAVVAKAILKAPDGKSPIVEAVGLLHRVASGAEPATIETKVQAAGTLVRTAAGLVAREAGGSTVSIDARSVTLVQGNASPEALVAADRLLACLGGDQPGGARVVVDGRGVRPDA